MNVGELARDLYDKHEGEGALAKTLLQCFFGGVIIKRQDFLLLAEPCFVVPQGGKAPYLIFNGFSGANGWYLHFWASEQAMSPCDLCMEAPYSLTWVAYKRRRKIRALLWDKLCTRNFYVGKRSIQEPRLAVPC